METRFMQPIDVIEKISTKQFKKNYLKKEIPIILRGFWKNYSATTKWTTEYFKEVLGDIEVGVFDGSKQKSDQSFKYPHLKMKFGEYLDGGFAINQRALSPKFKNWIIGFWHVAILTHIEDIMSKIFGENWFKHKSEKCDHIADDELMKLASI